MDYNEHMAVLPNNKVKCTLCDTIVHGSNSLLLEAHLHDAKHKELYMKSLMVTNNIAMGSSDSFCYICNCPIEPSNLIPHVQTSVHRSNYAYIEELVMLDGGLIILPEKTSKHSFANCLVCDTNVDLIHSSIKSHILTPTHKYGRAMVLQPMNGIFSVEGSDKYLWCKICQIFFDNYVEVIFQHVEESEHANKIAKILRLIDRQHIDIETYLQDYKEDKAFCNKCDIVVPCNVDNLQSHIRGKKHKN